MKEENSRYSISDIKAYIQKVAAQANSFPEAGEYATPQDVQDILEDKYDLILDGMNKFLATI
jgi:predicted sulfurtransferase